ncbi:MAG: phage/plasmid primase, P4 family [Kiloniellaceae bacterium]
MTGGGEEDAGRKAPGDAIREAVDAAEEADFADWAAARAGGTENLDLLCAWQPKNDLGNARRLMLRYGQDLIYIEDVGWYCWSGKHWDGAAGDLEAQRLAHRVSAAMKDEAKALREHGAFDDETRKAFEDRIGKHYAWSVASGNSGKVHAMLREAVPYLARKLGDMDPDPFVFNTQNGTLHLKRERYREEDPDCPDPDAVRYIEGVRASVTLRGHERDDRCSKISPVPYRAAATAPVFRAFLERVLPDPAVRGFLQRYFGYALTADTSEQCLVLLHGIGANGKSTLVEIVSWLLGDYALTLPFASLLHDDKRRGSEATPDIARLPGARLVSASEPEIGQRFSESLLKSLTGGETITARHLNRDFFEFSPTFKLVLSFNHKPNVRGQDEGIWRRLFMVPFDVTIPLAERDRDLLAKLREEGSGILNWLIEGARLWMEEGLAVPEKVRAATEAYRSESDPVGQFMASATRYLPGSTVQASRLYKAYTHWCHESAVTPLSQTAFGKTLGDRGYTKSRIGTYFYENLELDERHDPGLPGPEEDAVL